VWTRRAGGNPTVAILTTMSTSLACFVVTPAWLHMLTGQSGGAGYSCLFFSLISLTRFMKSG
jgi:predicted Na+-dependent transporter